MWCSAFGILYDLATFSTSVDRSVNVSSQPSCQLSTGGYGEWFDSLVVSVSTRFTNKTGTSMNMVVLILPTKTWTAHSNKEFGTFAITANGYLAREKNLAWMFGLKQKNEAIMGPVLWAENSLVQPLILPRYLCSPGIGTPELTYHSLQQSRNSFNKDSSNYSYNAVQVFVERMRETIFIEVPVLLVKRVLTDSIRELSRSP